MKRIAITLILTLLIIIGIVGCDNAEDISNLTTSVESSETISSTDITASSITESDEPSDISTESGESEIASSETESSEYTEPSVEESREGIKETSTPMETSEEESSEPSEEESSTLESSEVSDVLQTTEESEPDESEPPVSSESEPEVSEETSSEAEPEPFDIDYWIEYARNYAINVGLTLDETAVDCWDNPIGAGSHCIYLERDIKDGLNFYAKDEDITCVWIWAEKVRDNYYNLYIGYA